MEESVEKGEWETKSRIGEEKVVTNEDTKMMCTQMDKDNMTRHQPTLSDWVTNVGGSIDPIPVQWVHRALHAASIISVAPSANEFHPSTKGCSKGSSKPPLPLASPIPTPHLLDNPIIPPQPIHTMPKPTVTLSNGDRAPCAHTPAMHAPTMPHVPTTVLCAPCASTLNVCVNTGTNPYCMTPINGPTISPH